MTFTEKAAGEIAERIRAALEELRIVSGAGIRRRGVPSAELGSTPDTVLALGSPTLVHRDPERARTTHRKASREHRRAALADHPLLLPVAAARVSDRGGTRSAVQDRGRLRALLLYGQVYDAWLDQETRVEPMPEVGAGVGAAVRARRLSLPDPRPDPRPHRAARSARRDGGRLRRFQRRARPGSKTPCCGSAAIRRRARMPRRRVADVRPRDRRAFDGGSMDAWIEYLQPIAANIRAHRLPLLRRAQRADDLPPRGRQAATPSTTVWSAIALPWPCWP